MARIRCAPCAATATATAASTAASIAPAPEDLQCPRLPRRQCARAIARGTGAPLAVYHTRAMRNKRVMRDKGTSDGIALRRARRRAAATARR